MKAYEAALTDAAQRIQALESQLKIAVMTDERIRRSWDDEIAARQRAEAELRDAHAEIATLEAKLRTYGQHKADCEGPCICGGKYTHADDVAIIDIFCPMCDGGKACTCGLIDPARTPDR